MPTWVGHAAAWAHDRLPPKRWHAAPATHAVRAPRRAAATRVALADAPPWHWHPWHPMVLPCAALALALPPPLLEHPKLWTHCSPPLSERLCGCTARCASRPLALRHPQLDVFVSVPLSCAAAGRTGNPNQAARSVLAPACGRPLSFAIGGRGGRPHPSLTRTRWQGPWGEFLARKACISGGCQRSGGTATGTPTPSPEPSGSPTQSLAAREAAALAFFARAHGLAS
ncbi:MAG: hypothetical protein J3K34DRAFT_444380 [Monoraphidium minutum]|nr:MAG: hypothetical protein J3K34DRAFT_444380 [Monoraphidium minutum]